MKKKSLFFISVIGLFLFFSTVFVLSRKIPQSNTNNSSISISQVEIQPTSSITTTIPGTTAVPLKKYIHKKYEFSFFYPEDWQILDEPNVFGIEIQKVNAQGAGFSIAIRVIDSPGKITVKDYALSQAFPLPNGMADTPQAVTIGNLQGYKLNHLPDGLLFTGFLPYKQPGKIVYIFAGGEFDKSSETVNYYKNIINTILNSLKFE